MKNGDIWFERSKQQMKKKIKRYVKQVKNNIMRIPTNFKIICSLILIYQTLTLVFISPKVFISSKPNNL